MIAIGFLAVYLIIIQLGENYVTPIMYRLTCVYSAPLLLQSSHTLKNTPIFILSWCYCNYSSLFANSYESFITTDLVLCTHDSSGQWNVSRVELVKILGKWSLTLFARKASVQCAVTSILTPTQKPPKKSSKILAQHYSVCSRSSQLVFKKVSVHGV